MKYSWLLLTIILSILVASSAYTAEIPAFPGRLKTANSETIMAVGDLGFVNGLGEKILKDPNYPWAGIKEVLNKATILVGNLEVPFSQRGQIYTEKTWTLRANPQTVSALSTAGFDVLTLANNHMMDFGPPALQDTIALLKAEKLAFTGAGQNLGEARKPAEIITPNGVKIAFLAYSLTFPDSFWAGPNKAGTAHGDPAYFIADIKKAKEIADLVVVSFHWSSELLNYPKDYQENYGRKCIDAGAALVLGHHPHVLQGLEVYHGGLIAYSLGNFAFGTLSNKVKDSIILAVEYDKQRLIRAKIYPVNINNYEVNFQTKRYFGKNAERVIQDLRTFSKKYNTEIQFNNDIGIIEIQKK